MEMPCFGLPLGEGDFNKQSRVAYLLDLARKTDNARMLVELKGDSIEPDGWVREFHKVFAEVGGQMVWHPGPKLTKKMATLSGDLTPELFYMGQQADELRGRYGLLAVTIHLMPAVFQEPSKDAGFERYNSPISAETMLDHITSQVTPIRQLNEIMGGILNIETVDITNFVDGGCRLPTYLALQTGAWMDLPWLAREAGVRITADSEHTLCAGNLLMRRRDMAAIPRWLVSEVDKELLKLANVAGYFLKVGEPPQTYVDASSLETHFAILGPHLYHFGGGVQANLRGTLGTHLPFDEDNAEQMRILDMQLEMIKEGQGIGGVVEVVGQLDPARYDPWSPRIVDDEEAKRHTLEVVLRRWAKISG
jgi:hypothetical protein